MGTVNLREGSLTALLTTALRPRCAAPRRSRTCSPGRRCRGAPPAPPPPPCRCWRRGRRSPPSPPPAPPPPASPWCRSLTSHCRCHSILGSAHIAAYHPGWRDDGLLAPDHILFILLGMIIALLKCSLLKYTGSRWEKQLPGELFTRDSNTGNYSKLQLHNLQPSLRMQTIYKSNIKFYILDLCKICAWTFDTLNHWMRLFHHKDSNNKIV